MRKLRLLLRLKKYKDSVMSDLEELQHLALALEQRRKDALRNSIDALRPDTRMHEGQLELYTDVLSKKYKHYYLRSGNQASKTSSVVKLIACFFKDEKFPDGLPKWVRPKEWGNGPLTIVITCKSNRQIDDIWGRIEAFLDADEFKPHRPSGSLQSVTHKKNGNRIILVPYDNPTQANERLAGYSCMIAWVDELPTHTIISQLHRRVQAKSGMFFLTATPEAPSPEVKRIVDNAQAPLAKLYRWPMRINPLYHDEAKWQEILNSIKDLPLEKQRAILYGDWVQGDYSVFNTFSYETCVREPQNYSEGWRHVLGLDPAISSRFGYCLLAECPLSGQWYVVRAGYFEGLGGPTDYVRKEQETFRPYRIVRRIVDSANSWYIMEACRGGISYTHPWDKNNRRDDMIAKVNGAFGKTLFIAPWATEEVVGELTACQWNSTESGKIVNSHKYHVLDSLRYAVDMLPKFDPTQVQADTFDAWMLKQDAVWRQKQAAKKGSSGKMRIRSRW